MKITVKDLTSDPIPVQCPFFLDPLDNFFVDLNSLGVKVLWLLNDLLPNTIASCTENENVANFVKLLKSQYSPVEMQNFFSISKPNLEPSSLLGILLNVYQEYKGKYSSAQDFFQSVINNTFNNNLALQAFRQSLDCLCRLALENSDNFLEFHRYTWKIFWYIFYFFFICMRKIKDGEVFINSWAFYPTLTSSVIRASIYEENKEIFADQSRNVHFFQLFPEKFDNEALSCCFSIWTLVSLVQMQVLDAEKYLEKCGSNCEIVKLPEIKHLPPIENWKTKLMSFMQFLKSVQTANFSSFVDYFFEGFNNENQLIADYFSKLVDQRSSCFQNSFQFPRCTAIVVDKNYFDIVCDYEFSQYEAIKPFAQDVKNLCENVTNLLMFKLLTTFLGAWLEQMAENKQILTGKEIKNIFHQFRKSILGQLDKLREIILSIVSIEITERSEKFTILNLSIALLKINSNKENLLKINEICHEIFAFRSVFEKKTKEARKRKSKNEQRSRNSKIRKL